MFCLLFDANIVLGLRGAVSTVTEPNTSGGPATSQADEEEEGMGTEDTALPHVSL